MLKNNDNIIYFDEKETLNLINYFTNYQDNESQLVVIAENVKNSMTLYLSKEYNEYDEMQIIFTLNFKDVNKIINHDEIDISSCLPDKFEEYNENEHGNFKRLYEYYIDFFKAKTDK